MSADILPNEVIGRRIVYDGEYGTVRYVGTVPPTSGLWLGIEWDNPLRGKHDGSHEERRYFTCRHPTGGSFLRPKKANFGVSFLTALIKRYGANDEWNEKMVVGSKHVELVGFQSVQEQQSENRLYLPPNSSLLNAFENLTVLSLNQTGMSWKEVLNCAAMWPVLEELHLASNNIASLERPVDCLCCLTLLNISNNNLTDGNQLHALSELPRLKQLIITNNQISSIKFPVTQFGYSTTFFSSLTNLSIDGNNVSQWSFINELNKLKCLEALNCQNNPLMESKNNPDTVRQLVIAKIANLKYLNKTEVLPDERRGAELDYRKMFAINWLKAGGCTKSEHLNLSLAFLTEHPRYPALVEKYGAPDDGEIKSLQPANLKNKLLSLTIKCPDTPNQESITKNLPDSMSVQKLKGLLYRLLKVPGSKLKLTYISSKMEDKEIELENDLKSLQFYSIENGDCILVRW